MHLNRRHHEAQAAQAGVEWTREAMVWSLSRFHFL
jgi:hypothetical protein